MASAPPKPKIPALEEVTNVKIQVRGSDNGNGGATITQRQIGWGTSSSSIQNTDDTSTAGGIAFYGLTPNTRYYFWYRVRNSVGWSPWSDRLGVTTHDVPSAPARPTLSEVTSTSLKASWTPGASNGAPILENDVGYGTGLIAPTQHEYGNSPVIISGLTPSTNYRVWVRHRNAYGWGEWSLSASVQTESGGWYKDGTQWRKVIPYVKYDGYWKPAQPFGKIGGLWKEMK